MEKTVRYFGLQIVEGGVKNNCLKLFVNGNKYEYLPRRSNGNIERTLRIYRRKARNFGIGKAYSWLKKNTYLAA